MISEHMTNELDLFEPSTTDTNDDLDVAMLGQCEQPVNIWLVGQQVSATQRKNRYVQASFVHPAKMLPELARKIINTYSKPGQLVVDLMSGIGTTGVEALWLGREYIGVEIEPSYVRLQEENIANIVPQTKNTSIQRARVLCGDARMDHGIRNCSLVTFSPPYQDAIHDQGDEIGRIQRKIESGNATPELLKRYKNWQERNENAGAGTRSSGYSPDPNNLGHSQGEKYWEGMREVYERAYQCLQPGGYLVIVTKDQRDRKTGELTNLYGETVSVCREIGFHLHQHVIAVLCKIDEGTGSITPRTSHWQRMAVSKAAEKGKVVLLGQFEDVTVFRKPC